MLPIEQKAVYIPDLDKGIKSGNKSVSFKAISDFLKSGEFVEAEKLLTNILGSQKITVKEKEKTHYLMGLLYLHGGPDFPKDINKALEHLTLGSPTAKYTAGVIYLKGLYGAEKNAELGMQYLRKASDAGSHKASFLLGYIDHLNKGDKKDEGITQTALARFVLEGPDLLSKRDVKEEARLHKLIERSDLSARPRLFLKLGDVAWKKWENTEHIFEKKIMKQAWKAAKKTSQKIAKTTGNEQAKKQKKAAQRKLGIAEHASHQYEGAIVYWKKAASEPFPDLIAQYYLGLAYMSGEEGVQKDEKKGLEYLTKASNQGLTQATTKLNHLKNKQSLQRSEKSKEKKVSGAISSKETVIKSKKSSDNRLWAWIKKHPGLTILGVITTLAVGAIIAGLVAATIFFPHVMIPIWIVTGVVVLAPVIAIGAVGIALHKGVGH
jgi:TPR repeat protein